MDLATGALGTLLPKLRQLLEDEYKLDKGVKKSIEFLSGELESMCVALRNVGEVPREQLDRMVKMFAREAREMSYDTEDIIDTFLMRVQEPEPPSEMKRLMKKMVGRLSDAKIRREFCEDIMNIKEHVKDLAERRARYKVDDITTVVSVTPMDPRLAALFTEARDIVGIEGAKKELYMMLLHGDDVSMRKQRIASIVGYAGLGKTTLALAVCVSLRREFDCTAFVSVSRNPDLNKLLKDMLYQLGKEEHMEIRSKMFDEKQITDGLRKFLRDKRYLIVLDDIWDIEHWKIIQCALPDNNLGSRIITTTRKLGVAEVAGGCYKLEPLSDENSRRLFYCRIFGPGIECPQELLEVSEKILKKCGGVPLALVTTSSLLAIKMRTKYEWHKVCDSIGSGLGSNIDIMDDMRSILSLSYYDLPSHLKTCLLYLSIFPEDSEIRKDQLIWRWIAEDFVQHQERDRSLLFEIGESYFNELVNRSLVQPTQMNNDGTPCACRVHVMVLDLICSLSREESFVVFGEQDSGSKIRRLALHNRNGYHSLGDNMGLRQLRSLNAIGCPTYVIPPVSSFFHLRVLDLENCGSMEGYDLKYLGKLLCLKFMGLRNTFVRKLPEEIGHLKFLQTLELEGSGVEELPARMGELTGLMRLNADWMTRVPDWIGKLTSMQQLVMYPGSGDEYDAGWFVKELGKMGELRVLRFLIKAQDEGQLTDLLKSLSHLKKIEVIHFDYYGVKLNARGVSLEPTDLALSKTLRFLELRWLEFASRPSWINPQDLPHLRHLWLMVFDVKRQDLEILGGLPELRHLHLLIMNTEGGENIVPCGNGAFMNLKFCSITKPLQFLHGAMPRLEVLDFHFNVRLLMDASHNFNFDFGLGNLHLLEQVIVQINCLAAFPEEVRKAEAALWDAIRNHPNRPKPEIRLFGQRMDILNADLIPKSEKTHEPSDELISMLSEVDNDAYNDKKMKILSIVRSEGLGETSLAQQVFDKLIPQFDCGAFVQVGQNADLRKVLTDILIGLDKQKYNDFSMTVLDLMQLIGLVRKCLINKRFFVVVDDIWDLKAWNIIKCALIENSNGSAVLTTRSRQNWKTYDDDKWHFDGSKQQSHPGSTADPKNLFYKKMFGSEDKCPPELKDICEKLIETCDGMPLVIIETVELLASVPRKLKDWQAVYDRRVIAISYPDLPDHLRNCLLYFTLFPKGYEISRERLVWAWIAEDFVEGTGEQTLHEPGESYLSELVKGKMIEAVEVDAGGKALLCRVYDWVHDFIILKSAEANFSAILKDSQDSVLPDTVHRLSMQANIEVHTRPKAWLSQVKSLVVSCDNVPSVSGFPALHVMDLGGCDSLQAGHLKGINSLIDLRYLVIGGKCLADIPKEITKLKHLQTLDLSASGLSELPESVFLLKQLKRLRVKSHMKIPDGIAKMSALQELGDINIIKPELLKELRKLTELRVLRIAIWSWDESFKSSVEHLCDILSSLFVRFMEKVHSFSILTCCSLDFMDGLGDKWAPQSLQNLEIRYSAFDKLPSWFDTLPNISSLTIEVYKLSQDIIDMLGKLPTLHSLSLISKQVPERSFFIGSSRFKNLASLKFASNAMPQNMFAAPQGEVPLQIKRLTLLFQASRTQHINKNFSFGLENLCFLEHVRVEIICFNASNRMMNDAEAAIWEAVSKDRSSSHPNLEIRRLYEKSMIQEVDLR